MADDGQGEGRRVARRGKGLLTGEEREPPRDGRAARALRTRKAVADALLALIEEGDLRPTSKAIAERAGVSERTIFQHFEDLETLFSVAADRVGDRIVRNLGEIPANGAFEDRLSCYLDEIVYMHESMTSIRRASRLHEPFSPVLNKALVWLRKTLRRGIERTFARELDRWSGAERRNMLEALAVVAAWSSWENMRSHGGFGVNRARRVLEISFRSLLEQPPVASVADDDSDAVGDVEAWEPSRVTESAAEADEAEE